MRIFKLMLFACTCFLFFESFGQSASRIVSGTVADSSGTKMPGVAVAVKGTRIATVSDDAGHFSINVPQKNNVLEISSVGFATQEVTIGTQSSLSITLMTSSNKLDEVVVVGYGTSKKRDVTGSISSIQQR